MRWGTELWDRFEDISNCVHKGVEFCERYEDFWKKRCSIENSYAKSLRKLIESYEPKKRDADENNPTYIKCFIRMLSEIRDIAGQHELIAENVQENVLSRLNQFVKMLKEERRKCIEDKDKYLAEHLAYDDLMEKCRVKYEKSFREVEKAEELLVKVENDDSASKNDIKKQKSICDQKKRQFDALEADYAKQLCEANRVKNLYYYEQLPAVFDVLENIEKKRIDQFKEIVNDCVKIELEVLPRIKQCLTEIQTSSESINSSYDTELVVNLYKTGYQVPADYVFDDLKQSTQSQILKENRSNSLNTNHSLNHTVLSNNSNSSSSSINGGVSVASSSTSRQKKYRTLNRIKGLFTAASVINAKAPADDTTDLPPAQLKNELVKKIQSTQMELEKQQKEREGLLKLREIYSKNQKFGDSQSAEQALKTNEDKITNLQKQLAKYQEILNQVETNLNQSNVYHQYQSEYSSTSGGSSSSSGTLSKNHIYQSPSRTSVNSAGTASTPGTPVTQKCDSAYAVSQIKMAPLVSSNNSESFDDEDDDENYDSPNNLEAAAAAQDVYEQTNSLESVIGTALVMYAFEGTVQNSISIEENESLNVLEKDSGDGWTLVKKLNGERGYVPTDYIQIVYY